MKQNSHSDFDIFLFRLTFGLQEIRNRILIQISIYFFLVRLLDCKRCEIELSFRFRCILSLVIVWIENAVTAELKLRFPRILT